MRLEERWGELVHNMCEEFAATGRWPTITGDTGLLVWDRVTTARACGQSLQRYGLGPAEGEWLCWLLVEHWEQTGISHWRERMRECGA